MEEEETHSDEMNGDFNYCNGYTPLEAFLCSWAIDENVKHWTLNKLLKGLRFHGIGLPGNARTLTLKKREMEHLLLLELSGTSKRDSIMSLQLQVFILMG
jgi:hypothetical protein